MDSYCPRCHQGIRGLELREPATFTVCGSCCQLSVVADDLTLRLPTPEEWDLCHASAEYVIVRRFKRAVVSAIADSRGRR